MYVHTFIYTYIYVLRKERRRGGILVHSNWKERLNWSTAFHFVPIHSILFRIANVECTMYTYIFIYIDIYLLHTDSLYTASVLVVFTVDGNRHRKRSYFSFYIVNSTYTSIYLYTNEHIDMYMCAHIYIRMYVYTIYMQPTADIKYRTFFFKLICERKIKDM